MFGMLDYRAHKLYALLHAPFGIVFWIIAALVVPAAAFVVPFIFLKGLAWAPFAISIVSLICGILAMETVGALLSLFLAKVLFFVPTLLFKFLLDPVPANGRSKEEADFVVKGGNHAIALLAFNKPPVDWTDDDIERMALINPAPFGMFFRDNVRRRILRLREYYIDNPDISANEYNANRFFKQNGLSMSPLELVLTNAWIRNMVIKYLVFLITAFFVLRDHLLWV